MMLPLYLDEDSMNRDLVQALRARGVDVLTALEVGMIEYPDEEHLIRAVSDNRVLYSFNVEDFYRIHTAWLTNGKSHVGMILAQQQRYSVGEQMRRFLKLIATRTLKK